MSEDLGEARKALKAGREILQNKERRMTMLKEGQKKVKKATEVLERVVAEKPSYEGYYLLAESQLEAGLAMRYDGGECLEDAEDSIKKAAGEDHGDWNSDDTYSLWGRILLAKAFDLDEGVWKRELLIVDAGKKVLRAADSVYSGKREWELLTELKKELSESPKERARFGEYTYLLAGEFIKQGGGRKSKGWKTRWFVLNDSYLAYYKDRNQWEKAALEGKITQPQGIIEFSGISGIFSHGTECLVFTEAPPKKMANTHCLHISIPGRTFNILGLQSEDDAQEWIEKVECCANAYRFNSESRKWLKENPDKETTPSNKKPGILRKPKEKKKKEKKEDEEGEEEGEKKRSKTRRKSKANKTTQSKKKRGDKKNA